MPPHERKGVISSTKLLLNVLRLGGFCRWLVSAGGELVTTTLVTKLGPSSCQVHACRVRNVLGRSTLTLPPCSSCSRRRYDVWPKHLLPCPDEVSRTATGSAILCAPHNHTPAKPHTQTQNMSKCNKPLEVNPKGIA